MLQSMLFKTSSKEWVFSIDWYSELGVEAIPLLAADALVIWGSVGGGAGQLAKTPMFLIQLL